ncbi:MAG: SpoIIE family protein phosphatase [Acidobacteriota bacterium]
MANQRQSSTRIALRLRVASVHGPDYERILEGPEILIGRSTACHLSLDDQFLSRRHTRIVYSGGVWRAIDLGSRNGTVLNGRSMVRSTELKTGDQIRLSTWTLTILPSPLVSPEPPDPSHTMRSLLTKEAAEVLSQEHEIAHDAELLRLHAKRLLILNDVHRELSSATTEDDLLDLILDHIFEHFEPTQGSIFVQRGDEMHRVTRRGDSTARPMVSSSSLLDAVVDGRKAVLAVDAETDELFHKAESLRLSDLSVVMAAPLLDAQGCLGMIAIGSSQRNRNFNEDGLTLLVSLASIAALSLRNLALVAEATERARLEQELILGRRIQNALIPDALPDVAGFDVFAMNKPSDGVSGDYYQVVESNGGQAITVMIADVSGKGIGASLLTASLEALAAGMIEDGVAPAELFELLSRRLHARTPTEKFATAFLAVLDPSDGALVYANAGHNPGFLIRPDGSHEALDSTGPPLGLLPEMQYRQGRQILADGDLVVLYTDGLSEASNPQSEELGEARLLDICRTHRALPLPELLVGIERDIAQFVETAHYADDRTVVLVRRQVS